MGNILTKYRTQVMGIAILWIMMFHLVYLSKIAFQLI